MTLAQLFVLIDQEQAAVARAQRSEPPRRPATGEDILAVFGAGNKLTVED